MRPLGRFNEGSVVVANDRNPDAARGFPSATVLFSPYRVGYTMHENECAGICMLIGLATGIFGLFPDCVHGSNNSIDQLPSSVLVEDSFEGAE